MANQRDEGAAHLFELWAEARGIHCWGAVYTCGTHHPVECHEIPVDLASGTLQSFASDPHGPRTERRQSIRGEIFSLLSPTNGRTFLPDQQVSAFLEDNAWCSQRLAEVTARAIAVRLIPVES